MVANQSLRGVKAVANHRAEGFFRCVVQRFAGAGVAPDDHAAAPRNQVHQSTKRELIGFKIRVDVGVIEFQRGDDQVVGLVMEELCGFVPIRGIVFVAFQDEILAAAEAIALTKILGNATNQKIRAFFRHLKNPREHRCRGRFPVRATHDDGVFAGKKFFFEDFRQRFVNQLAVEHFLHFDIAAGDGVANHDQVGGRREMRGVELGVVRNAERFEKNGGGRIYAGVGTGHAKAAFAQHSGERRHGRAANANHVDVLHHALSLF